MKRFIFIGLFILYGCKGVSGQYYSEDILPYIDLQKYNFGFHIGMHIQNLIFSQSAYEEDGEVVFVEIPSYVPGFSVGLISEYRFNEFLNLRISPSLHIGQKRVEFIVKEKGSVYSQIIRSPRIFLPVDLKYNAFRIKKYRPYLIGGIYQSLDLGRRRNVPLLLKQFDYGLSIGAGCAFYFNFFKLCPEIRWYFGLENILDRKRHDINEVDILRLSKSVKAVYSGMFTITFNFE